MKKTVIGYMCYTDFLHELGEAAGGVSVYSSMDDILNNRSCATSCGVARVKVKFLKTDISSNFKDGVLSTEITHYRAQSKRLEEQAKFCLAYADKLEKEAEEKEKGKMVSHDDEETSPS